MMNSSLDLYKSAWTDLVFKNKNKSYGAYLLRAESSKNTVKAFLLVTPIFILLFAGPLVYNRFHPEIKSVMVDMRPVDLVAPPVITPPVQEKKMELPKADPLPEKVKMVKLTSNFAVVKKPVVEENLPTVDEIKDALVGSATQDGVKANVTAAPIISNNSGGSGTAPVADNNIYEGGGVEKFPEFEGGMSAWAKFLQRNMNYPIRAQEDNIQGKVILSFVVEKDGSITDVTIIRGIGGGCDQEAMRVIKKSPRWKPGIQNKQNVRVRFTMPFVFQMN